MTGPQERRSNADDVVRKHECLFLHPSRSAPATLRRASRRNKIPGECVGTRSNPYQESFK